MAVFRRVRHPSFLGGACAAAIVGLAASCESRDVFLVPQVISVEGPAEAGLPQPGTGGAGTGGSSMMFPPAGGGPGVEVDAALYCEKSRHPQEPRPLGVYVMVDQSSAMKVKWESVKLALSQFVRGTDGLGKVSVGLQFYAKVPTALDVLEMPTPTPEEFQRRLCDWNEYRGPDVPIIPTADAILRVEESLTQHGPTIVEALVQVLVSLGFPETGTSESPIGPAIRGAVQGARDWVAANEREQRKGVVPLVTDRIAPPEKSPTCMPTLADAVLEASYGLQLNGGPEIRTYVLGVGGPNPDLDAVAAAGGTGLAYLSDQSGDLLPSLNLIRDTALPCDIEPEGDVDASSDFINVDVRYVGDKVEKVKSLLRVPGAIDCRPGRIDEWYSDSTDGGAAKVRLCPESCNSARSLAASAIEVVYGCRSKRRID